MENEEKEVMVTLFNGEEWPEDDAFLAENGEYGRNDHMIETYEGNEYDEDMAGVRWSCVGAGHYYNYYRESVVTLGSGQEVSEHWADDNTHYCDSCGGRFMDEDYNHNHDCCNDCVGDTGMIHCYSTDVLEFYNLVEPTKKDFPYTLGVELEVEEIREYSGDVCEMFSGEAILKEDGSLDDGFEIVTRPAPYLHHRDTIWTEDKLKQMREWGGRSFRTSSCGLHVHVGRKGLTSLQIAKAVCFMNSPDNRAFIKAVAQRDPQEWASITAEKYLDKKTLNADERYVGLNLCKQHTVEFRIFKGTIPAG